MQILRVKSCAIYSLYIILIISLMPFPAAHSTSFTSQDKALSIITDVFELDTPKYTVELTNYNSKHPSDLGSLVQEDMTYSLVSTQNEIKIKFAFVNNTVAYVDLRAPTASISSANYREKLPPNILDATKIVLQRLKIFSNASYIQPMLDSMNGVSDINSVNMTIGNIKRQITVNTQVILVNRTYNYTSTRTSIYFTDNVNGAYSPKSLKIDYTDGAFVGFSNGWDLYSTGSEKINIQQEEAINIARELANNASTAKLNYADRSITANLRMLPREPFVLYPFWFVELPLDYPNSTFIGWQVGIWADTREIAYSHPVAVLGSPPNTDPTNIDYPSITPTPPANIGPTSDTQAQPENSQTQPFNTYLAVAAGAIIAIVVIATAVVLKKRGK